MEVARDLKGRRSGCGRVAGHASHRRDRLLDRLATQSAAVMDARDLQALDSAPGNAAHGLHRQVRVAGAAVEAGGGNGVESLLSRRAVARREGHGPLLHVAPGCDPGHVLHGGVNRIDAALAAEVDACHFTSISSFRRRYAMAYTADRARGSGSSESSMPSTSLAGSKSSRCSAAALSASREVTAIVPSSTCRRSSGQGREPSSTGSPSSAS